MALQVVHGAFHTRPSLVQNMGINHSGLHVFMAEQRLDRTDIIIRLQKMQAKLCRKVWEVTRLVSLALRTAS